jgi:ribosomal-protein-serine acetyltransferase
MFPLEIGKDLELRLLSVNAAEALFQLIRRNLDQLRPWLAWVEYTHSAEDVRRYIISVAELHRKREALPTLIFSKGELAGAITLHKIDERNRSSSIGYWLGRDWQGRGIMTAACRAMVAMGFHDFHLHRIEIRCAVGNQKSCAIPQRLGFTREGIAREAEAHGEQFMDLVVWSMLAHEWHDV